MATKTMTVMQPTQYPSQFPLSGAQATNSNRSSPTSTIHSAVNTAFTTPNTSPTSTKTFVPNVPRQVHPPKSPMYRPAALRTTDWGRMVPKSGTKPDSQANLDPVIEDEIEIGNPGECTGPPSRGHWKPDAEASQCDAPFCNKAFTLFERRHHCRKCGNIFCATHTPHMLPLDQNSKFNTKGYPSRVCDTCNNDYKRLCAIAKSARTSSDGNDTQVASPIKGTPRPQTGIGGLKNKIGSYVGSVPRDWTWSTF